MNTSTIPDGSALWGLEPRLRKRYRALVDQHSAPTSPLAAGLRALPGGPSAFAATQAAWRFWRNPAVTLPTLLAPVLEHVRSQAAARARHACLLVAHDWCWLNFTRHTSKPDRITPTHPQAPGYTLCSALAISSESGAPLGPLSLELTCAQGVHTSRSSACPPQTDPAGQLQTQVQHTEEMALGRRLVHVVDRGADAVAIYRFFQQAGRLCLIRADGHQRVEHQGASRLLSQVPDRLVFAPCGAVLYKGRPALQSVAGTRVVLTRPDSNGSHHAGGGRPVPGPPVRLRLVVSDIRDAAGRLLSRWYLYTNVDEDAADDATVGRWYYWRWRIECFHKLLKSAGWNVEDWQQESGLAVAKRLAVVSMAAALVWAVAHTEDPDGQALAQELVRLSGRQRRWGRPVTAPALLAGLWTLLGALELLERYEPEHLRLLVEQWRAMTSALGP